ELVRNGILTSDLVVASSPFVSEYEARIRPGTLDGADVGFADLDPRAARLSSRTPREQIDALCADLAAFKLDNKLDRVVVVNLASTEAYRADSEEWKSLAAFEAALQRNVPQPASLL